MNFDQLNLHSKLVTNINKIGFKTMTPIQKEAIPAILNSKDVLGLAQTGTGKTAAFVLPIIHSLLSANTGKRGIRSLIIAPTRELSEQIESVVKDFSLNTGIKSTTIFGGVSSYHQIRTLKAGVDIVIACPGRLLDLLSQNQINLSNIEVLVLDEADQMFDMGFFPTIKKIFNYLPKNKQSLLFSATMPEEIRSLAKSILNKPHVIDIGLRAPVSQIEHALYPVSVDRKNELLLALFKKIEISSAIVFTKTKHRTKKLAESLLRSGFNVTSLQGNLSQNKRREAMEGFRKGKYKVLVATDIAARGIDISSVSHVINFDIPNTAEAYTHRIGRTGRASRSGQAYTFVTNEDTKMVRLIEKTLGAPIQRCQLEGFSLDKVDKVYKEKQQIRKTNKRNYRPNGRIKAQHQNSRA